ncbi:MAG: hypothetical protein H6741_03180 [Alphaproteobacteria bacterium]|nr:hypothetical protein [Alphaproteobacteria bacterium]
MPAAAIGVVADGSATRRRRAAAVLRNLGFEVHAIADAAALAERCEAPGVSLVLAHAALLETPALQARCTLRRAHALLPRVIAITRAGDALPPFADASVTPPLSLQRVEEAMVRADALRYPSPARVRSVLELMEGTRDSERVASVLCRGLQQMLSLGQAAHQAIVDRDMGAAHQAALKLKSSAELMGLESLLQACVSVLGAREPELELAGQLELEALASAQGLLRSYREAGLLR